MTPSVNDETSPIDGLLDEWLGQRRPSIISLKTLQSKGYSPERIAEFEAAVKAAKSEMNNLRIPPLSARSYRKQRRTNSGFLMLASLAASLLIIAGGWYSYQHWDSMRFFESGVSVFAHLPDDHQERENLEPKKPDPQPAKETATKALTSDTVLQKPKLSSSRETLSTNLLPFETTTNATQVIVGPKSASQVTALSESEIVKSIDDNLKSMWDKNQVRPSAPVSDAEWIARATKQIFNRQPTESERERFVRKDSQAARTEWLAESVNNTELSKYWGKQLAAFYLGEPLGLARELEDSRREFVKWCQGELSQASHLNSIAYKVVVLDTTPSASPTDFSPSRFWWRKMRSVDEHAVVDLIENRMRGGVGSCSRCHDSGTVGHANQSGYWNVAAIAQGVNIAKSADGSIGMASYRSVAEPLFYERDDASMVVAVPALPNGQPLEGLEGEAARVRSISRKNLKALGDWLVSSDDFAKRQVDFAWEIVFGQPLLGRWADSSEVGQLEREALAKMLGQQLIAHDYDLAKLVTWLAKSQGFQRKSADLDLDWYVNAGETDLRSASHRTRMLGVFPATREQNLRLMSRVENFTQAFVPKAMEQNGVLANPLLPKNPAKAIASQPLADGATQFRTKQLTAQQVEYLTRVYALPQSMELQLDRLLKSKLTWHQMVEHAFLMTGFEKPNPNEIAAADRIMDWTRDRRQTLRRILAARL